MKPYHPILVTAALLIATASQANRATDTMRAQFHQQGVSDADIARTVIWRAWDDIELLPGIFQSMGGFTSRAQPPVTLRGVQLANESDLAVCVRFRGQLLSGPLLGGRGSSREGTTMLVQPGQREVVMAHTLPEYVGNTSLGNSVTAYYFWLPAASGSEGRCAANRPSDLDQWLSEPLPQEATVVLNYSRELAERMSAAGHLSPVPRGLRAPRFERVK